MPMSSNGRAALIVLTLGCSLYARSVLSQTRLSAKDFEERTLTVVGTVASKEGQALPGAEVISGATRSITNDRGEFELKTAAHGNISLLVRRIGYQPSTVEIQVEPNISGISVAATLARSAVTLGTIVVEGKTLDKGLWENGYYKRKDLGFGTFFDPERLARNAAPLSTIIQEVPLLEVERRRGRTSIVKHRTSGCVLPIILDGVHQKWAAGFGLDDVITPGHVKAMEVYSHPSQVPMAVLGLSSLSPGGTCGVIVLWTKDFEAKDAADLH